jgi:hypothetical protein
MNYKLNCVCMSHHSTIIIINNFKAWANWSVPRQLSSQLVMFSPFQCLRVAGGKPAASAQFLLNPESSARAI